MASPVAGTYRIVPYTNPGLSLDVAGGSMKNGANVRQWTANFTNAQFFVLDYRKDGSLRILSRRSGKCIDVANGKLVSGTNVQQYTSNGTRAQQWDASTDGGTGTFKGETYPTYTIKLTANSGLALDVAGNSATSGTNVRIWTANGTDAQRWMLVPKPEFASGGIYELRSIMKTSMAVDVSGGSALRGANVQLYSANGTNAQKFYVTEDTPGHWSIQNVGSGMYVDVKNGSAKVGTNVQQWTDNDTRAQRWKIDQFDTTVVDGVRCAVVTLGSYVTNDGHTYNMDVRDALTSNHANILLDAASSETSQRFALYPTEPRDESLPVPGDVGWCATVGSTDRTRQRGEALTYYPSWHATDSWPDGAEGHYESRRRYRSMDESGWSNWTDYTPWQTVSTVISGRLVWDEDGLQASVSPTQKCIQYELQVRAAATVDGRMMVGHFAAATLQADQVPTLAFGVAGFGPEGLRISYTSDYYVGTTNIVIDSIQLTDVPGNAVITRKPARFEAMDSAGSLLVPMSNLTQWLEDGTRVSINYRYGTDRHYLFDNLGTFSMDVSYDTGSGMTVTPTISAGEGRSVTVSVGASASVTRAWLSHDGQLTAMPLKDGRATVCPPFGGSMDYEVYVAARSSDGDRWGVAHLSAQQVSASIGSFAPCHAWNWPGGSLLLEVRKGDPLSTEGKVGATYAAFELNDREWQSVHFARTRKGTLTAEGSFGGPLPVEGSIEALEALMKAHYATYRSPHGLVAEVAVTDYSYSVTRGVWDVQVEMVRVTN